LNARRGGAVALSLVALLTGKAARAADPPACRVSVEAHGIVDPLRGPPGVAFKAMLAKNSMVLEPDPSKAHLGVAIYVTDSTPGTDDVGRLRGPEIFSIIAQAVDPDQPTTPPEEKYTLAPLGSFGGRGASAGWSQYGAAYLTKYIGPSLESFARRHVAVVRFKTDPANAVVSGNTEGHFVVADRDELVIGCLKDYEEIKLGVARSGYRDKIEVLQATLGGRTVTIKLDSELVIEPPPKPGPEPAIPPPPKRPPAILSVVGSIALSLALVVAAAAGLLRRFRKKARSTDGARGALTRLLPVAVREQQQFDPAMSAGLFVGISNFVDSRGEPSAEIQRIPYAVDDAVDLAGLFAIDLGLIDPRRIHVALSGKPTKKQTVATLATLRKAGAEVVDASYHTLITQLDAVRAQAGAQGMLVTSFATHGYNNKGNDRLLCQDSLMSHLDMTSLPLQELLTRVAGAPGARRRVVFVDACREVLVIGRGLRAEAMAESFKAAMSSARGTVVLSATVVGGYSYDNHVEKNGVFTSCVLKGLRGEAASDEHGFVTPRTLAAYVHQGVRSWVVNNRAGQLQESTGISVQLDGAGAEMPLAVDEEKWELWAKTSGAPIETRTG
jgi:hypothetical protein